MLSIKKKIFSVLSLAILVVLIVLSVGIVLKHNGLIFSTIETTSQISNLLLTVNDKKQGKQILQENSVVDNKNVKRISVTLVENISDPMDIQLDEQGAMVISGAFTITQGRAEVYIALGQYVKGLSDEEKTQWVNAEFWKISELIVRRNTQDAAKTLGTNFPDLYYVTTR